MPERPVLSIVVGTYNRLEQLRACVDSIARETRTPYVLYVTDAGSTDGTVEYLQSIADDHVKPILVGKRLGQAKAYNDVFFQVATRYVCWISDDNVIVDRGLDTAVDVLRDHPRIGLYALKVKDRLGPFVKAPYIGGFSTLGILNVNQGMLPTEVLLEAGGFGEPFRDYGIDPDLTAKVLFLGKDVVYGREVAIHHYRNWSTDPNAPEYHLLKSKQVRSIEVYEAKYGRLLAKAPWFELKKKLWKKIRSTMPNRLAANSAERVLGQLPRDWNNIWSGRFISVWDPWINLGKPFHLRQRIPAKIRRRGCPVDPIAAPAETVG
jgi:GT2 family glycosyltransferase